MPETLYINKPGGVVVHTTDGSSTSLAYGDPVPDNLADYVDAKVFADTTKRKPDVSEITILEAQRRAALAEGGQVNSASSPVPGNYSELDEEGAAQLVADLSRYPEQQLAVLRHEQLFGNNRQMVIDAAGEYAQTMLGTLLSAESEATTDRGDVSGDPVTNFGDPLRGGIDRDDAAVAKAIQERAASTVTPPPSGNSPDAGPATGFEALSFRQLGEYAEQHQLSGVDGNSKNARIEQIKAAGHEQPQTPTT